MKDRIRKFALLIVMMIPLSVFAQEGGDEKAGKHEKEAARRKQEQMEMQEKAIERGRQRQIDIQTKNTQKRMKQSQKKARRFNEGHKEFFLFKLFHRRKK